MPDGRWLAAVSLLVTYTHGAGSPRTWPDTTREPPTIQLPTLLPERRCQPTPPPHAAPPRLGPPGIHGGCLAISGQGRRHQDPLQPPLPKGGGPAEDAEAPASGTTCGQKGSGWDTRPGRDGLGGQAEGGERAPHGLSVVSTGKRALGSDPRPSKCSAGRKVPEMGPAHPGRPLRPAPRPRATEPAPGNLQRELLMREPGSEGRAGW